MQICVSLRISDYFGVVARLGMNASPRFRRASRRRARRQAESLGEPSACHCGARRAGNVRSQMSSPTMRQYHCFASSNCRIQWFKFRGDTPRKPHANSRFRCLVSARKTSSPPISPARAESPLPLPAAVIIKFPQMRGMPPRKKDHPTSQETASCKAEDTKHSCRSACLLDAKQPVCAIDPQTCF